MDHERARPARDFTNSFDEAQAGSLSSCSHSVVRSTGEAGCIVETACL
jgi:hypothetical protein